MTAKKEMILYYNPNPTDKVIRMKGVLVQMGIRIRNITGDQKDLQVGFLAGISGFEEYTTKADAPEIKESIAESMEDEITEEILIMKDFSGARIDELLINLRKAGVPKIGLKAVLTETNSTWTLLQLYQELKRERASFEKKES